MLWLGLVGNCDFGGIYFCGVVSCIHDGRLSCSNKKVVVQITYCSSKVSQGLPAAVGSSRASSNEDRPVVALTSAGTRKKTIECHTIVECKTYYSRVLYYSRVCDILL